MNDHLVLNGEFLLPHDIFAEIISWIPAYPYYYSLRRVSKKWKKELEERIYETRVELLDLLEMDQSRDESQKYRNFVNFTNISVNLDVVEGDTADTTDTLRISKKRRKRDSQTKPQGIITRPAIIKCLGNVYAFIYIWNDRLKSEAIPLTLKSIV